MTCRKAESAVRDENIEGYELKLVACFRRDIGVPVIVCFLILLQRAR